MKQWKWHNWSNRPQPSPSLKFHIPRGRRKDYCLLPRGYVRHSCSQPEEIARSYVFLASNDAAYVTGQTLHPNGGTVVNG